MSVVGGKQEDRMSNLSTLALSGWVMTSRAGVGCAAWALPKKNNMQQVSFTTLFTLYIHCLNSGRVYFQCERGEVDG